MSTPAPDDAGGQGDCVRLSRSDLLQLRRAARQDWGVPDVARNEAIYQCLKILADPDASERNRLAASKALIAMDRADSLHHASHRNDDNPRETIDPDAAARALEALLGEAGPDGDTR